MPRTGILPQSRTHRRSTSSPRPLPLPKKTHPVPLTVPPTHSRTLVLRGGLRGGSPRSLSRCRGRNRRGARRTGSGAPRAGDRVGHFALRGSRTRIPSDFDSITRRAGLHRGQSRAFVRSTGTHFSPRGLAASAPSEVVRAFLWEMPCARSALPSPSDSFLRSLATPHCRVPPSRLG
jgi:hypothetical protein